MLSCKEVSLLESQSMDRRLTLLERLGVSIHLLYCKACPRLRKQMQLIRAACQQYAKEPVDTSSALPRLTPEARERIQRELHRKQADHGE